MVNLDSTPNKEQIQAFTQNGPPYLIFLSNIHPNTELKKFSSSQSMNLEENERKEKILEEKIFIQTLGVHSNH
ncbi:hypothetical protein Sjap_017698 [Stephania japonica]|uniref:Uncharacterized protein n=1 Tax=Stephania japonica TaxID=461633 RepID=A0AAP0I6S5_9MAGN